jgi:hypothetical protein
MPESKYGELIATNLIKKSKHTEVTAPKVEFGEEFSGGKDLDISWYCITEPFILNTASHVHDFDEYICFTSSSALDMNDYEAEVEISLGKDGIKRIITEPAIVYFPKGLIHSPVKILRLGKPISYTKICVSPQYSRDRAESDIRKCIIKKPSIQTRTFATHYYVDKKLKGKEEKYIQELGYSAKDAGGGKLLINWYVIKEPCIMYEPAHVNDRDEYEFFMGGDSTNVREFDAEIDLRLGAEAEKYKIDSTSMVHIRKGLFHRQIEFRRVDKPIIFINFSFQF